jgi:SNF2 family DNA or RNA helicase
MPKWVNYKAVTYQSNHTKAFLKKYQEVYEAKNCLRIFSFHIETFSNAKGIRWAENVIDSGTCLWALDESTRIKKQTAKRTKSVLKLSKRVPYKRIASGAPITQGVEDLYTQLMFLDEDILGFSSFYTFRNHYCVTRPVPNAPPGAVQIVGYKNLDELKDRLDAHTFRVTKQECLDLPEKVYMTREIEMSPQQQAAYLALENDLIVALENGAIIETPMAITQLMKLQQILCGFIIDDEGNITNLSDNRIQETINIVEQVHGKVIIWSRFREDIRKLALAVNKAGISFVEYHGGVAQEARRENLRAFMQDPNVKVFIANPTAGGTGLNLAMASTAIYYSNDFNADTRWQSEDRIHRIGQKNNATYIDLLVPGTIDAKILGALRRKKNVADSVLSIKEILKSTNSK